MSEATETIDVGREALERELERAKEGDRRGRYIAILVGVLTVMLAILGALHKDVEDKMTSLQKSADENWDFYQNKTLRVGVLRTQISLLEVAPNPNDPVIVKHLQAANDELQRLRNDPSMGGMVQLVDRARTNEKLRDSYHERANDIGTGILALQIAIVLASAAAAMRTHWLSFVAGAVGLLGVCFALAARFGLTW